MLHVLQYLLPLHKDGFIQKMFHVKSLAS